MTEELVHGEASKNVVEQQKQGLLSQIREVAELRELFSLADEERKQAESALLETDQGKVYAKADAEYKAMADRLMEADAKLRDTALMIHTAIGETKPLPELEIKRFSEISCDKKAVRGWLGKNAPAFLIVDWKAFNKAAETLAAQGAPVKFEDVFKCYVAKDLSGYLDQKVELKVAEKEGEERK